MSQPTNLYQIYAAVLGEYQDYVCSVYTESSECVNALREAIEKRKINQPGIYYVHRASRSGTSSSLQKFKVGLRDTPFEIKSLSKGDEMCT